MDALLITQNNGWRVRQGLMSLYSKGLTKHEENRSVSYEGADQQLN